MRSFNESNTVEAFARDLLCGSVKHHTTVVGTATQSLNDDMVRTFPGNPSDHVEPGTGEVRTRYEVRVVSFIFLFPWLDCVDQVFWSTT